MATGYRDLSTLVFPPAWDLTELAKIKLADGTTYAEVADILGVGLAALNSEIANDPLWSALCYFTDAPTYSYRVGVSAAMGRHTEYGLPDPQRAEIEGHMLPYAEWDYALGWTRDYLRRANMEQVTADIALALQAARDRFRLSVLTRLLKRGDDSGSANGLGTSGYSPGFATAAAATNVDFTPLSYGGISFTSDHEHYVGIAGGAWTASAFADMVAELREHGHEPPYDFITGPSDEAAILNLSTFVPVAQWGVNYGSTATLTTVSGDADGNGNRYIGVINNVRVRIVTGMPQYYGFAWKSYGVRSQRNPVRVRLDTGETALRVYAEPDSRLGGMWPLTYMLMRLNFGVGVGDRTNGTPRYNNNTTWVDGVPT